MKKIKITRTRDVKLPERGTEESAGLDFFMPNDITLGLSPHERALIPSGIHVKLDKGTALIAKNKSGVSSKFGLDVLACVVDSDYQGEIHLSVVNTSDKIVTILPGTKVCQFVLFDVHLPKVEEVSLDNLYDKTSERGEGGFGSTGQ
jgi:dUTP pyrophosphatase